MAMQGDKSDVEVLNNSAIEGQDKIGGPDATAEATPSEPNQKDTDYQALYEQARAETEEAKQRATKAEHDAKSIRGLRLKEAERDAILLGVRDELAGQRKTSAALVEAIRTGDTVGLPEALDKIDTETAESSRSHLFEIGYDQALERASAVATKNGFNLDTAPELEGVRQRWNKAERDGNLAAFDGLVGDIALTPKAEAGETTVTQPEPAPKARVNLDLQGPSGGAGEATANLESLLSTPVKNVPFDQLQAHAKRLREQAAKEAQS